ncbi:MAG: carboxylating nicotinate-nucleotide diphosphorylase [Anaerolineae bacterium]|nr:carboxylating nicotinate-nucleotide diphosphorylase [Anaerolineae bacterium]
MTNNILSQIKPIIQNALAEDIGDGDVTSDCIIAPDIWLQGQLMAKADGIVAGLAVVQLTFGLLDERVQFTAHLADSEAVETGTIIATVSGPGLALLSGERVALNLLQRMSGIATLTHQFVQTVSGTKAVILDTRKTAPGLRLLDKWAVRLGGGQNHRLGLYDMVLIKDNHITAAGSITAAVQRVREKDLQGRAIEVEVKTLAELQETLTLGVDRILLDNMSLAEMRQAVQTANGRTPLEASGNVSLDDVAGIAATGVDYISVGALTHSVKALDISLLLK